MSTPIDNGGYAFPVPTWQHPNGDIMWGGDGMTLRDWFAGQALAGMLAHPDTKLKPCDLVEAMRIGPWKIADAMIEARKGKETSP